MDDLALAKPARFVPRRSADTILRWHPAGFRAYWRWKSRAQSGRPPVSRELRELIRRMSKENPLWGARRIHGRVASDGGAASTSRAAFFASQFTSASV
jgi:hypothetical protein